MSDARISLLAEAQVTLRDQDVSHGQHAEASELLWGIEHDWWESRGHLGVQTHLDPRLYLILTFDEEVEHLLGVHSRLTEVGHQTD